MSFGVQLDNSASSDVLDYYFNKGYNELDTALVYGGGKTEVTLGQIGATKKFIIATKANPMQSLSKDGVEKQLKLSLSKLQTNKVNIFYLHAPDHNIPIEETLEAVNEAYSKGKFEIFGISNYAAWQVSQICEICKAKNWILPKIYQGMYNILTRDIETELIPCLRYYGISFYAYNPLAGGILSGKYNRDDNPKSGRFDIKSKWGQMYRDRFWNDIIFDAIDEINLLLSSHDISILDVAIRWMYHHSVLSSEYGDAVILGGSSLAHVQTNIESAENPALTDDVVKKLNDIYASFASKCPTYFR